MPSLEKKVRRMTGCEKGQEELVIESIVTINNAAIQHLGTMVNTMVETQEDLAEHDECGCPNCKMILSSVKLLRGVGFPLAVDMDFDLPEGTTRY